MSKITDLFRTHRKKIEKVCPRLAYVFRIAFARRELIRAFSKNGCISPNALALLAGVGYTYIIKLIREEKIPVVKKNRQWCISPGEALNFLSKYTEEGSISNG